jgi:circadian clock protein KaiC
MTDSMQRISTGNPEADLVLGGGFPANSINILMGEPGTGKTLIDGSRRHRSG